MPEAARSDDEHVCHFVEGNHPHRGGPVAYVTQGTVMTGHLPQARAGDRCRCDGAADFIVTGSRSVYVDGKPAARRGDRTMHAPPGEITGGCASVRIGGPRAGISLGGGVPSGDTCLKAAMTRESRAAQQSYGNCGVESIRQLVNLQRDVPITETEMLNDVIANHEASGSVDPEKHGGSNTAQNVQTLRRYGVPAQEREMTFAEVVQAVAEGRGVITAHYVSILWGPTQTGRHAVLVAGLRYDSDGNLQAVEVNDTGAGQCAMAVEPSVFERSLIPGTPTVVTDRAVW